jgi:hypothetical protein
MNFYDWFFQSIFDGETNPLDIQEHKSVYKYTLMTAHQTLLFCFVQAAVPALINGNTIQNVYVKILLSFNLNMFRSVTPITLTEREFQKSKCNHLLATQDSCVILKSVQRAKAPIFFYSYSIGNIVCSYSFMRQQACYFLYGQHKHHFCQI